MNWQEVCTEPNLQNLPYKIELNERGQIIMSPVRLTHSAFQAEIQKLLQELKSEGKFAQECAIKTRLGTKVADVAWFSNERWEQVKDGLEASIAPEICIEVLSPSNTEAEMQEKRQLYFEQGAHEVWICDEEGHLSFYHSDGQIEYSKLAPQFPMKVEI